MTSRRRDPNDPRLTPEQLDKLLGPPPEPLSPEQQKLQKEEFREFLRQFGTYRRKPSADD